MKPVIQLIDVHKKFVIKRGRARDFKNLLIKNLYRKADDKRTETRTVLNSISFTIYKGEFVGIMGRNGVGKSTILKILAGIYQPTSGRVITSGSIAPVLELGAGFALELSGYENIFLNASILGYSRRQISEKAEDIIAFSELGEAIHEPLRNYSSGMLVRLAFSIVCHLDAETLLFDEVLAVGDLGFQRKCLEKIRELQREGRTIILVTHSTEKMVANCNRCIILNAGDLVFDGTPREGGEVYKRLFT